MIVVCLKPLKDRSIQISILLNFTTLITVDKILDFYFHLLYFELENGLQLFQRQVICFFDLLACLLVMKDVVLQDDFLTHGTIPENHWNITIMTPFSRLQLSLSQVACVVSLFKIQRLIVFFSAIIRDIFIVMSFKFYFFLCSVAYLPEWTFWFKKRSCRMNLTWSVCLRVILCRVKNLRTILLVAVSHPFKLIFRRWRFSRLSHR